MEMPVFTIRGKNHRERGVDYGVQCKELIQGVLERYIRFFNGGHTAVSWDEAKVISKEFLPFIRSYSPELLDELEGIAQGADVEFDDLLTLNSRSEAMTLVRRPPSDKAVSYTHLLGAGDPESIDDDPNKGNAPYKT